MNRLGFLLILISLINLTSCETENEYNDSNDFQFEASVIGKGLDCGETFAISLKNRDSKSDIEDGMYYADQLDAEFKIPGLEIYLNCREPNDNEFYACTMLGPSCPHVIVTGIKIRD